MTTRPDIPVNATAGCCRRPDIARMDYLHFDKDIRTESPRINRVCLHCLTHFFGVPGAVKQYTGAEWDAMLWAALTADRESAS
jgi:hypothetical protein